MLAVEAVICVCNALVPSVPVFVTGSVLLSLFVVWWNVVTVSLRQRLIPGRLLSRVNSAYRMLGGGMMPRGALAGGALVSLTESWLARSWALRTPFLLAAALCTGTRPRRPPRTQHPRDPRRRSRRQRRHEGIARDPQPGT